MKLLTSILPSSKLTWQWKFTFSKRKYIFKWWIFHSYVSLGHSGIISKNGRCKLQVFLGIQGYPRYGFGIFGFILFSLLGHFEAQNPKNYPTNTCFFLGFKTSNDQKPPIPTEKALTHRHERCELLPRNHSHIVTMWIRKVSFSQAWCN